MKISEERKELFRQIMEAGMDINEAGRDEVFLQYSPHVKWLTVDVYYDGWGPEKNRDVSIRACLYAEDENSSENTMKKALDLLNRIKGGERI